MHSSSVDHRKGVDGGDGLRRCELATWLAHTKTTSEQKEARPEQVETHGTGNRRRRRPTVASQGKKRRLGTALSLEKRLKISGPWTNQNDPKLELTNPIVVQRQLVCWTVKVPAMGWKQWRLIGETEQGAKLLESSHAWLGASTSSIAESSGPGHHISQYFNPGGVKRGVGGRLADLVEEPMEANRHGSSEPSHKFCI
ncbi:hypothetical protein HUJ04_008933 [Dendroctonus ponderosae]|nr:hypothetical protein HUJ04_008933 [Dendroctonus ponderosae]